MSNAQEIYLGFPVLSTKWVSLKRSWISVSDAQENLFWFSYSEAIPFCRRTGVNLLLIYADRAVKIVSLIILWLH